MPQSINAVTDSCNCQKTQKENAAGRLGEGREAAAAQPAADNRKRLLTENEVAELLRVSPRTLRRWRRQRAVPFYTLPGGAIRYSAEALSSWMQRGCPKPRSAEIRIAS